MERLEIKSNEVLASSREIRHAAQDMMELGTMANALVNDIAGAWQGKAAGIYISNCQELAADIKRTSRELEETSNRLQSIAQRIREIEQQIAKSFNA